MIVLPTNKGNNALRPSPLLPGVSVTTAIANIVVDRRHQLDRPGSGPDWAERWTERRPLTHELI